MVLLFDDWQIRDLEPEDAEQMAAWWNNGAVMAHAGFPNGLGISVEEIRDSIRQYDPNQERMIIEKAGVPVGEMNWRRTEEKTAEIGIKICDASYQNQGFGKKLLTMLIQTLFYEMSFEKVVLDTNLANKRAQHVYEELGFVKTCVLENSWKNQVGEWQSSVCYELKPENFISFL